MVFAVSSRNREQESLSAKGEIMNRKLAFSAAVLSFSFGILPCVALAEDDDPPPPPNRSDESQPRRGPERNGFLANLTKEERAKLTAQAGKVAEALAACKAKPGSETKAALQTQVAAFIECHQKLAIAQAEKAAAHAKECLENKTQEASRQTEQLLNPRRDDSETPPERDDSGESRRRKGPNDSSDRNKGNRKGQDRQNSAEHILMRLLMLNSLPRNK